MGVGATLRAAPALAEVLLQLETRNRYGQHSVQRVRCPVEGWQTRRSGSQLN